MTIDFTSFLFVLLSGLCFGSLISLLSYRLPLGEDVVIKPSRCPKCDTQLKFVDLWPVLSWLTSKGRCRYCMRPISWRYPLIETVTASMFMLLYYKFGLTGTGIIFALAWVSLMVMMIVDIEHFIIPDSVHLALIILGAVFHYFMGTTASDAATGLLAGAVTGLALQQGYRIVRGRDGLGFGDVKFLAVAGLWLGVKSLVPFLFFAGVFGIITGLVWKALRRGPIFPFGPALALALFLGIVYPELYNLFWNIGQLAI